MAKYINLKTEKSKYSYLIQRLQKPYEVIPVSGDEEKDKKVSLLQAVANAFSFGGGLMNGGLSKDAMSLLKEHFRFDYMGAAEYEWGAVPEAFAKMAEYRKNKHLIRMEIDPLIVVPPRSYSFLQKPKKGSKKKETVPQKKEVPVYIICSIDHVEHITMLLHLLSKYDDYELGIRDSTNFRRSVHGEDENYFLCHGWLELDNGFMFFIDQKMYEGVASIYNLTEKDILTLSSEEIHRFSQTAEKIYKETYKK